MNNRIERIRHILTSLQPETFEIIDQSHLHSSHYHSDQSDATHIKIIISSPLLDGKSKIQQHRIVYGLLREELGKGLHALSIEIIPTTQGDFPKIL